MGGGEPECRRYPGALPLQGTHSLGGDSHVVVQHQPLNTIEFWGV